MRDIPEDIYERVHELALGMVNASEVEVSTLRDSFYQNLLSYFHEQAEAGRSHPFLTEALADFTNDNATSVTYFRLALEQSKDFPHEPLHTKMISLAERLIELGCCEQAEAYLTDGRAEAVRLADADSVKQANELLRDCGS